MSRYPIICPSQLNGHFRKNEKARNPLWHSFLYAIDKVLDENGSCASIGIVMLHRKNSSDSPSAHSCIFPVAAWKFAPPLVSSSQVSRTAVHEQVGQANNAKLILFSAPAGFGKTTTMGQFYASLKDQGVAAGWLAVDTSDNDLGHFAANLAAAFACIDPLFASMMVPPIDVDGFALELLNRISAIKTPFVLFLDDFEAIENQTILHIVKRMLVSLPRRGILVVGARELPNLGLGRLRARGQLLEIELISLQFSLDETSCLLRDKRHLALEDKEISKLHRRTEGWVAALQLAALSLAAHPDYRSFVASFSGSNAEVAEYLAEDVFAGQSLDVQNFLLRTSILQELSPSLCDAVSGRNDSRDMLSKLDRGNLFLLPLDSERRWHRYHSIFADFLRLQLHRTLPSAAANLHRRAAVWYAEQERPVPAIEHALSSGMVDFALPLLSIHAEQLLWQGRVRLLTRWIDALSPASVAHYPKLRLVYAWALCLTHRYTDALAQVDAIGGTAGQDVEAQTMALQMLILAMTDRPDECHQHCRRIFPLLPFLEPFTHGMVTNLMAYCLISANRYGEARVILDQAKYSHAQLGVTFGMAVTESIEGVIELVQGRLRNATVSLRNAFSREQMGGAGVVSGRATVGVLLAVALYEADELAEAGTLLAECLPLIRQTGTPDTVISAHLTIARITLLSGDRSGALRLLCDLEHLGHEGSLPRAVASAWLERSRMALHEGEIAAALEYLQSSNKPEAWKRCAQFSMNANDIDILVIGQARLSIRQGRARETIDFLQQHIAEAESVQRHRRALKLKILLAEAYQACGHGKAALKIMAAALRFASKEGFIRTFADEGATIIRLVMEMRTAALREGRAAADIPPAFLDRILQATGQRYRPCACTPDRDMVEALTEREVQVLQMVAEGHPNRVLAEQLFVAETTVKAHLRNITTKLAARNRTDAVAIARRIGLIQR